MLYSNEKSVTEKLSPINNIVYKIENDAIAFETYLKPEEIIKTTGAIVSDYQHLKNEGLEIYYCFVENINNFVVSEGKKINLQI